MSDENTAGSSLLLAQHHIAQREHSHSHPQPFHQHHHRTPHGEHAHKRDAVTDDVVTISIIQEINVDRDGNTIGIKTIQTHLRTPDSTPAPVSLTEAPLPTPTLPTLPSLSLLPAPVDPATLPIIPSDSQVSSTVAGSYPTIPGLDVASVPTSTPSVSATFPSLVPSSNSTTLISSLSSLSQTYTNSSVSTKTSLSYLRSSRSSSLLKSSTSSFYLSSSAVPATSTDGAVLAAGTGVAPGGDAQSTATASASGNNSNETPTPTPVVIGGVVGSLAGVAVLLIALLYIIRWRKRGKGMLSLGSGNDGDRSRGGPSIQPSGTMTEQSSHGFVVPAALAALTGYSKRFSQKDDGTISSTAGSERGFYRVSGRKLPSVLQTGGDGYGSGMPNDNTLSGSSFYRDSDGFYGGGGTSSTPIPISLRDSAGGIPFIRPSPARTPTQEQSPFSFTTPDTPPPPPRLPDGLGRSRASQDGSHGSRFTEQV